jgi:hypothetical protein
METFVFYILLFLSFQSAFDGLIVTCFPSCQVGTFSSLIKLKNPWTFWTRGYIMCLYNSGRQPHPPFGYMRLEEEEGMAPWNFHTWRCLVVLVPLSQNRSLHVTLFIMIVFISHLGKLSREILFLVKTNESLISFHKRIYFHFLFAVML